MEYQAKLKSMDVRSVNFLLVNPGKKVGSSSWSAMAMTTAIALLLRMLDQLLLTMPNITNHSCYPHLLHLPQLLQCLPPPPPQVSYLNFQAETSFKEDTAARNMRATMPQLFELNRLQLNHELERLATVGRNSQLYLGREKMAAGKKGEAPQVLFLRSISLSPDSVTKDGAERVFQMALDELDRAALDSRVSATASSRVFLNILPEVQLSASQAVANFEKTMDYLISKVTYHHFITIIKLFINQAFYKLTILQPTNHMTFNH